jgi:hypothetical protein
VRQSMEDYVVGRTERRLEKQAPVLVKRHKMAIAMVAVSLKIKTTLTAADVRALIEDSKRRLALTSSPAPRSSRRLSRTDARLKADGLEFSSRRRPARGFMSWHRCVPSLPWMRPRSAAAIYSAH